MDRRFLLLLKLFVLAVGCAVLLSAGCASEEDSMPTGGMVGPAETHRPVIEEPATAQPGSAFQPQTDELPLFTESPRHPIGETPGSAFQPGSAIEPGSAFEPGSAMEPSTAAPEESAQPTFSAEGSPEFNPLRIRSSPDEVPNPLRSFVPAPRMPVPRMSEPRMSAPREFAPESAPESSPATVGSAPPAAAADPEFRPAAIEPPEGAAAGGPSAPSTTRQPLAATAAPFEVVQVFYGTDRAAIDPAVGGWMTHVMRFMPTGFAVLITLSILLIAATKRSTAPWVITGVGVLACIGLGYQASANTLFAIRWDGKQGPQYTIDRSAEGQVQLGVCEVTIPSSHDPGAMETPSILRLEVRDDAKQHVVLSKTEPLADESFYELLRQRVQTSPRKELFVFIHGFDTQFEDAARRTAQIHYDLKFQGAPVFFSWPANNKSILTYPADENTIGWSAPHLKQFLLEIVKQSDAKSINLIAHSMGNRALSIALREIELEFRGNSRLFHHVVLAAPDIDADEFRKHIAPAMQRTAHHVTLYASSRDDALRVSQLLHRGARAGDSGRGLVVLPGMDTIDVTAIDTSPWGHIYLGSSDPVLQDLKHLFLYGFPPQERRWLSPAQREGLTYWIFEATQTAARSSQLPR